jgi:hypothetical protein
MSPEYPISTPFPRKTIRPPRACVNRKSDCAGSETPISLLIDGVFVMLFGHQVRIRNVRPHEGMITSPVAHMKSSAKIYVAAPGLCVPSATPNNSVQEQYGRREDSPPV